MVALEVLFLAHYREEVLSQDQIAERGFLDDGNMLPHNQMHDGGSSIHHDMLSRNQTHDGGFHVDDNR